MTAKEYLRQIEVARHRVKRLRDTIDETLSDMRMISSPSLEERVQTSPRDRMPEYAARIDKYERQLRKEIEREEKLIIKICKQVDGLKKDGEKADTVETWRRILHLRYVDCIKDWRVINRIINYSPSQSYKLHNDALAQFAKQYLRQ